MWVEFGPATERATNKSVETTRNLSFETDQKESRIVKGKGTMNGNQQANRKEKRGKGKKYKGEQKKDDKDFKAETNSAIPAAKEKTGSSDNNMDRSNKPRPPSPTTPSSSSIPLPSPPRSQTAPPSSDGPKVNLNNRFRISGRDLVRERVPVLGTLFNICYSGVQASRTDEDDWVFGNIWFMNNYMTLDHRHRQIGIAPAVQPEL